MFEPFPLQFTSLNYFLLHCVQNQWIAIAGGNTLQASQAYPTNRRCLILRPDGRMAVYACPYRAELAWLDWQTYLGSPVPATVGQKGPKEFSDKMRVIMRDKNAKWEYGVQHP